MYVCVCVCMYVCVCMCVRVHVGGRLCVCGSFCMGIYEGKQVHCSDFCIIPNER